MKSIFVILLVFIPFLLYGQRTINLGSNYLQRETIVEEILVESITVSGAGNATTISTNGGTLQMSASILPVDADDQTVTWSRTNGTGTGTISVGGLVTASTDGTMTVRATANDGSGIYDDLELTFSNQGGGLGSDLIANGDFHDGNDWELPGDPTPLASIGSGVLTVNGVAWEAFLAQSHDQNANLDLVQATTYRVTFTIVTRTSGNFYVRVSGTEDVDHIWNTTGTHTTDVVAGAGDPPQIAFISYDAGFVGTIDNIMIQEVL